MRRANTPSAADASPGAGSGASRRLDASACGERARQRLARAHAPGQGAAHAQALRHRIASRAAASSGARFQCCIIRVQTLKTGIFRVRQERGARRRVGRGGIGGGGCGCGGGGGGQALLERGALRMRSLCALGRVNSAP